MFVARIQLALVQLAYNDAILTDGDFVVESTRIKQAKSASVYICLKGESIKIFALFHFQTVSVILAQPVNQIVLDLINWL